MRVFIATTPAVPEKQQPSAVVVVLLVGGITVNIPAKSRTAAQEMARAIEFNYKDPNELRPLGELLQEAGI